MLSPEWVHGTAIGTQPARTTYTPYRWFYANHLAPVAAVGLRYRLTESNDYLTGVPGASNAFASALWALDYLHWWAAHAAAGVNFHNKQWLYTDTIVPDTAATAGGYAVTPKGYGIKAFTLASRGQAKPVAIGNPGGINVTAYCIGGGGQDYVTIINKTHGAQAADAAVTIVPPGPGMHDAQIMTLTSGEPGDATSASATLGGAAITGDTSWDGKWSAISADPRAGISLTVRASNRRHPQDPKQELTRYRSAHRRTRRSVPAHPHKCRASPAGSGRLLSLRRVLPRQSGRHRPRGAGNRQ